MRVNVSLGVVSLLVLASSLVQAAPQIQSWTTSKGARVMFVETDALPMLDVRVVFDAGSARDGAAPGVAQFTNAMLTEGAGDWDAGQLAERVEGQGIQLGSGSLRDMAWVSVRTLVDEQPLEVAIDTLAKVLALPRFDAASLQRVRQQIQIGLRQALQSPGEVASREIYHALYGDHPYAHPPEGTASSLDALDRTQLRDFHKKYYVAANAVIAITGAVSRAQAEALAEQITAELPQGQRAATLAKPVAAPSTVVREEFPSSQTHIYVGQLGVTRSDPDYFPLYVGNHVLGGGSLVSLLGEEVRNQRGLSYSVYSYFSPMRAAGPFLMVAQTKNSQAAEALLVMQKTYAEFVENGPTKEQLDAAKSNIVGGFPLKVANNRDIVQYISMIGFYDLPLDWLDTLTSKVEAVTVTQVRDAFQRRVDPQNNIAVVVGGQPDA